MNAQEIQNIDRNTPLTVEEGYLLTQYYVNYFWRTNKYYSLKNEYEEEDVVQILMVKFFKHNLFSEYNSSITSKKYHVMNAVRTSMIDLLRKHREHISLESENEDGFAIEDTLESDVDVSAEAVGMDRRNSIINSLPTESRSSVIGFSEFLNRNVNLSFRDLALHLEAGFSVKEIAAMYKNPTTGNPISEGTISSYIRDMREYVLDNIVIA